MQSITHYGEQVLSNVTDSILCMRLQVGLTEATRDVIHLHVTKAWFTVVQTYIISTQFSQSFEKRD